MSDMPTMTHDLQILRVIVGLIAIFVVNDFISPQLATDLFRHHKSVVKVFSVW
jgi:hypothetical protein